MSVLEESEGVRVKEGGHWREGTGEYEGVKYLLIFVNEVLSMSILDYVDKQRRHIK